MGNNDLFDLDLQVNKTDDKVQPQITSYIACTPGTCWKTCNGNATFNSNCCIGKTSFTCA